MLATFPITVSASLILSNSAPEAFLLLKLPVLQSQGMYDSEFNENLSNSRKCPLTVHSKFADISAKEEREFLARLDRMLHRKEE